MNEAALYDFEGILEAAFATALRAAGLKATTSVDYVDFHKDRPRVDVFFTPGATVMPPRMLPDASGILHNVAFTGTLTLSCITGVKNEDKAAHAQYRAVVRSVADTLAAQTNLVGGLTNHAINSVLFGGADDVYNPRSGFEFSSDSYMVAFTIKPGALSILTQPTSQ